MCIACLQVRGIDLPGLDCVVMMYVPRTSDAYVHLAGRTGRGAVRGTALTIVGEAEAGRLGLFTSQLAISIRPWASAVAEAVAEAEAQAQAQAEAGP